MATKNMERAVNKTADREGKYQTFSLAGEIENAPNSGSKLDTAYILGMAKIGQSVKILLDIDKVMGSEETDHLKAA